MWHLIVDCWDIVKKIFQSNLCQSQSMNQFWLVRKFVYFLFWKQSRTFSFFSINEIKLVFFITRSSAFLQFFSFMTFLKRYYCVRTYGGFVTYEIFLIYFLQWEFSSTVLWLFGRRTILRFPVYNHLSEIKNS